MVIPYYSLILQGMIVACDLGMMRIPLLKIVHKLVGFGSNSWLLVGPTGQRVQHVLRLK